MPWSFLVAAVALVADLTVAVLGLISSPRPTSTVVLSTPKGAVAPVDASRASRQLSIQ